MTNWTKLLTAFALILPLLAVPGIAKTPQNAAPSIQAHPISDIQLSYKRDPRAVDSYRAVGPWASGPSFGGATGQDAFEVRAQGVGPGSRPVKISPQWSAADPEMLTISPSQGDDVNITVRKAGETKLTITYQGFAKELIVKATYVGRFMLVEFTPPPATKPIAPSTTQAPIPKTKNDVSYAVGMNVAKALEEQSVQVDVDLLMQGVKDLLSGGKTLLSEDEADKVLGGLQTDERVLLANGARNAVAAKNKREGEAFLAENKAKEGVVALPSGLQYKVLKAGEGKKPTADDTVTVRYRATFVDGKEFENPSVRQRAVSFPVKSVVKGLQEALQLMPAGSKWQLFVPADLAYGEHGAGGAGSRRSGPGPQIIGPNATLIFELELLSINDASASPAPPTRTTEKNPMPETVEALKNVERHEEKEAKPKSENNP